MTESSATPTPPAPTKRPPPAAAESTPGAPATKKSRKERRRERRREIRAAQVKRVAEAGVVTAEMLAETTYELRDGLRCVVPYYYTYSVHAKERWFGQRLLDVWPREFGLPRQFYEQQVAAGRMRINGEPVAADAVLRPHDLVTNTLHRHEPPVVGRAIDVIAETAELVVINKPASLSVHPCGAFRHNSVMFIMAAEHGMPNLHPIHRLDRMTSGVLLMGKSTEIAARFMKELQKGTMHKTYVARVVGCFPEGEVTVDQPIELLQELQGRGFRNRVGPAGKPATTVFRRLLYDEKLGESVVLCKPVTGRTHQIRLHLQWLKHPIVNDPVYNDELYNNRKGWEASEAEHTLLSLPTAAAPQECRAEGALPAPEAAAAAAAAAETEEEEQAKRPPYYDPECPWCATRWRDPEPSELVMYLHALSYDGPGWHYSTPMPDWALGATLASSQTSPSPAPAEATEDRGDAANTPPRDEEQVL